MAACIGTGEDQEIADKELDSWPACYNVILLIMSIVISRLSSQMELDIIKIVIIAGNFFHFPRTQS